MPAQGALPFADPLRAFGAVAVYLLVLPKLPSMFDKTVKGARPVLLGWLVLAIIVWSTSEASRQCNIFSHLFEFVLSSDVHKEAQAM